jgi:PTH1 family peptidyl-tRNA hydrolase
MGNPGVQYQGSRHNIGFQVVDRIAIINHVLISNKRFKTLYGTGWIDSQEVVLAKPMTFMNRTGEAVKKLVNFFTIGTDDLIVIHDDLDLPFGRFRFKRRGGDGGHQGVRSIIESMGGNNFLRLKVGIGRPQKGIDPAEYVLSLFGESEEPILDKILNRAADALKVMLLEGLEIAMNRYQREIKKEG